MDSDEEDFVFVGTPLQREEEMTSRKKKAMAEASGNLRSLPPWKQEVTDEEGRRRFHGAFTGGFSAGYYNTVGSKEGWAPQSFTSSRKNRAEIKQQNILNFMDDDEKTEMDGHRWGASSQFDTFGFTATEVARRQAEKEQNSRPAAIPGPIPDELILPAAESIGVRLLLKMGWRHGRPIKDLRTHSRHDVRREARKAFLALSSSDDAPHFVDDSTVLQDDHDDITEKPVNDIWSSDCTPVYVRDPKDDFYGLGYDPYKHAPEFREKQRSRLQGTTDPAKRKPFSMKDHLFSSKSGRVAPGFGIGALEDVDIEDEDFYTSGYDYEEIYVQEDEEPSTLATDNKQIVETRKMLAGKQHGVLPGFRVALTSSYQFERFDPPSIPKDFVPYHKFSAPRDTSRQILDLPPPEAPPPEDNNLKLMIEGVATLVARSGKLFEDLSKEKNQSNPLFSFLSGGSGYDYYARKLWEEQQKYTDQRKYLSVEKSSSGTQKMTVESRGKLLGERPLERSYRDSTPSVSSADVHIAQNLSDTFTKPESFMEMMLMGTPKPFVDDPPKQERFEQFLKDKYQGGLRSMQSDGAGKLSEAARARERLEFEAVAEAIEKAISADRGKVSTQQLMKFTMGASLQFSSGGVGGDVSQDEGRIPKDMFPKREEFQWRPAPLLCRRFDIIDPYLGKPPPPPRMRSKFDSLIVPSETAKYSKVEENTAANKSHVSQPNALDMDMKMSGGEDEGPLEIENVERPVDLYKAIFSDDSDVDEGPGVNQVSNPQKKIEAASTALSRLIAGDFLESLGKELGLEVLPEPPIGTNKEGTTSTSQKVVNVNARDTNPEPVKDVVSSVVNVTVTNLPSVGKDASECKASYQVLSNEIPEPCAKNLQNASAPKTSDTKLDKMTKKDSKDASALKQDNHSDSSSSEYERKKSRAKRHRHRCSDTYSSDDYGDGSSSLSRDRKRRSSRDRSHRRKHLKHKREEGDSPSRSSHHRRDRHSSEVKREKRK
ncbi:hypothetical protein Dimus_005110 [Dionaea muscipula]